MDRCPAMNGRYLTPVTYPSYSKIIIFRGGFIFIEFMVCADEMMICLENHEIWATKIYDFTVVL